MNWRHPRHRTTLNPVCSAEAEAALAGAAGAAGAEARAKKDLEEGQARLAELESAAKAAAEAAGSAKPGEPTADGLDPPAMNVQQLQARPRAALIGGMQGGEGPGRSRAGCRLQCDVWLIVRLGLTAPLYAAPGRARRRSWRGGGWPPLGTRSRARRSWWSACRCGCGADAQRRFVLGGWKPLKGKEELVQRLQAHSRPHPRCTAAKRALPAGATCAQCWRSAGPACLPPACART